MQTNVKILAWLHIILGILGLLLGCFIVVMMMSAGVFSFSSDRTAANILIIIGVLGMGITLLLSVPGIIAGVGLLQFRSWARVLALVLAFFNLFAVPQGTVFGIYTIISLLNTETAALFDR